jgi:hypothetical protein
VHPSCRGATSPLIGHPLPETVLVGGSLRLNSGSLSTLRLVMGIKRFFHVESKAFELVKNAIEVSIIERGRKHTSTVSMGFAAAFWLRDSLLEVAKLSNEQNVFRSFREGNKVYVVQKQRNNRGSFVTITVLGDSKGRGGVIIPEGRDSWGWRGVSMELQGLLNPTAAEIHGDNHRRQLAGKSTVVGKIRNESLTFKAAVIQGRDIPKILPIDAAVEKVSEVINRKKEVVLNLQVKLTCGIDGNWHANWAGLADTANKDISEPSGPHLGPQSDPITNPAPQQNTKAPKQGPLHVKQIWKPIGSKPNILSSASGSGSSKEVVVTRAQTTQVSNRFSVFQVGESSGSCANRSEDPVPPSAVHTEVVPQAESRNLTVIGGSGALSEGTIVADPQDKPRNLTIAGGSGLSVSHGIAPISMPTEVNRTWGSSSEWVLELRDGRRVSIPLSLLRQPAAMVPVTTEMPLAGQFVISEVCAGVGSTADDLSSLGVSECFDEEEEDEDNISMVWEDPEMVGVGNELMCWADDNDTLDVEPLAISEPEEKGLNVVQAPEVVVSPSDWVLGKSKRIGKVLGASYNGNEERINRLLMEIDGNRAQLPREAGKVNNVKDVRKGSRELKRLTCSINYDSDSAMSRGKSRERGLALSQ